MATIEVKPARSARPGARIFEPGGRTVIRINDDVLSPLVRLGGGIAVCDFSGNLIVADGSIVVTCVEMDPIDPILDGNGSDVLIRGWQGSVN